MWPTTSAQNRPPRSSGSEDHAHGGGAHALATDVCANCGLALGGPYCGACGQRAAATDPTFGELAAEAWDAFVSVDGKLVNSARLLLLRPGEMTARYLAGHRAPFVPPLRLYLSCSVAFFLVQAAVPGDARTLRIRASHTDAAQTPEQITRSVAQMHASPWRRRLKLGAMRASYSEPDGFGARIVDRAPQALFVLVPLQAVLLAVAYRRRARNFPSHLVFALHAHAAVFAFLAVAGALTAVVPRAIRPAVAGITGVAILAYMPSAMRRVYGGRWGATLARGASVGSVYVCGLLGTVAALVAATFWAMGAP